MAVVIKMIGGAKKSFPTDPISMDCSGVDVSRMLELLAEAKPPDTPPLDTKNMLVAINGADSSSLDGRSTILRDGDQVAIIPVIHGGSDAAWFSVSGTPAAAVRVSGSAAAIDSLRSSFPTLSIQAISDRFVLNESHMRRILEISVESQRRGILLSDKLETDVLLRLAGTRQIAEAIRAAGSGRHGDVVVVAVGSRPDLLDLVKYLAPDTLPFPSGESRAFLEGSFGISRAALGGGHALDEILAERASVL